MQYPVYGPYQAPGPRRPLWGGLSFRSYWEKRGIRQAALGVGVSFLLFYILQFGISLLLSVVLLLLGPAGEEAYALLTDPAGVYVQSVVLSALLFTLPFIIGARISRRRVGEVLRLGKVRPSLFVPLVCIGLGTVSYTHLIRDVRLFVNSITKVVSTMRQSGVDAKTSRSETDDYIEYTVIIPKKASGQKVG